MAPEPENNRRLEFGHVLFIDIVGYSKLLIEEQKERLPQLTAIVLGTSQVAKSTDEQLARLRPTMEWRSSFRRAARRFMLREIRRLACTRRGGSKVENEKVCNC